MRPHLLRYAMQRLREVMGFEPAEVCECLGISAPNCWVSLHRAKARLRTLVPNEV